MFCSDRASAGILKLPWSKNHSAHLLELCQVSLSLPQVIIENVRKEKEIKAESMIRTQLEMESLVYTQDSRYSKKLGKRKRDEPFGIGAPNGSQAVDIKGTLKEMVKHLQSYYKVGSHANGFYNASLST